VTGLVSRHLAFSLLLCGLAGLYLPATWSDQLASLGGDSAVYVFAARDYAPYLPPDPLVEEVARNSLYPPLYPALLAATGGAADIRLAHAFTTVCLLAAFAAFYAWLLAIGLSTGLAAVTVSLFAVMPGTYLQAFYLHSESLYLALSLAALAVLARAESVPASRLFWAASCLCALALITRTAGVVLLAPMLLVLLRKRPQFWFGMLSLALAPAMAWAVFHRSEQSYTGGLRQHYLEASLSDIAGRFYGNAVSIVWGLISNLIQTANLLWIAVTLCLVAAAMGAWRVLKSRADAWYVFAYLGLMVIVPYPAEATRYAWVLSPLALGYMVLAGFHGARWVRTESPAIRSGLRWGLPLALAVLLIPGFSLAINRWVHPLTQETPALRHLPEWYGVDGASARLAAEQHLQLAGAIKELGSQVPPDRCLFAIKPSIVTYYAQRHSVGPPFEQLDDETFTRQLRSRGCVYFILLPFASPSYATPYYPLGRLENRLEILAVHTSNHDESGSIVVILAKLKS
jgi:hypothetical protein